MKNSFNTSITRTLSIRVDEETLKALEFLKVKFGGNYSQIVRASVKAVKDTFYEEEEEKMRVWKERLTQKK